MKFIFKAGTLSIAVVFCLMSCSKRNVDADAFGSFESDNIIISAQSSGMILDFAPQEGQKLKAGDYIATIDTTDLILEKKKLELQIDILKQNAGIPTKLKDLQTEQLHLQLEQLNNALAKCTVISHVNGTVLNKYINKYELVAAGFPIVRIADLSQMNLKVYVTEDQLSSIRLGAECKVYIDDEKGELKEYQGVITWISSESEFTPKMIQTKKERVNLVYAVKIKVENDGAIKTGMPGEVVFR